MKNQILKFCAVAVVGFGALMLPVQAATYISGEIAFTGGATLNGPIDTATAFTSIFGPLGPGADVPVVGGGPTGNYAGVPGGTPVSFTPFAFDAPIGSPTQLWTFSVGPTTYSFDITSVTIALQGSGFLHLTGEGIAHITGQLSTPATWSITDVGFNGPVFTFGNIAVVPEPSINALLAGFGAVFLVFRYRSKQ
ncbi:MAG TPA: hypothetical protein VEH04_20670 [Verrucomicrobiae bacterium]|nr:hypothetical protein [Verrucomicrobiae bacterium]